MRVEEQSIEDDEALGAEFDVMAEWTAQAVLDLGADHAVPAGCRGSGSPAELTWLGEACGLGPGTVLLDVGAGVGTGLDPDAAGRFGWRPSARANANPLIVRDA